MSTAKIRTFILKLAPVWAFLAYGFWAGAVNYWAQAPHFVKAGLIQGTYAFITTLLLRLSVLAIYKKFRHTDNAIIYTYLTSFVLLISIPVLIHMTFGTQEIFYAVLPGAIIGSIYLFIIVKFETS